MFKNLLSFWKGKDFLAHVLDEFKSMLEDSEFMFKTVCRRLFENVGEPDLKQKIHDIDKKVNLLQKDIRKRVVEHLSLQPTVDVPTCLLLMSVVKDAERLGDYCKNLYEVTELLEKPVDRKVYAEYFDDINSEILTLFEQTRETFIEADVDAASMLFGVEHKIAKRCDSIVNELAKSNLSVNQAVCFTLIARHFKRIVAHLVNISTSVILPISDLDYFDEKSDEE